MSTLIQSLMLKLLVSLYLLSSFGYGFSFEGNETTENLEFHTVQLSSMQPSSTCIPSTKGSVEGTYLKLVHKHGPCSPLLQKGRGNALSAFETLKHDQSRIDAMQSMITKPNVVSLPCTSNYIVTVGLGTPKRELSLSFDTGSYLTWTQCSATPGHYFRQKHPLFVASKSKTFKGIQCSAPICPERSSNCSSTSPCKYSVTYGDKTNSQGIYSRDRLTLTSSDVINNFLFGCGTSNTGTFHELEEDGILGLSRNPFSIVQQTAEKYHQAFSYCIPSKTAFTGFLRFGGGGQEPKIYTAMTNYKDISSFYGINIIGISVGGKKLSIPLSFFTKAGAIVDSGTDVTRLPTEIYIPLRDAYRKAMSQYKLVKPEDVGQNPGFLDTCHVLGSKKSFKLPKVSFILSGGVAVDIPPSGIAFQVLETAICFPFSAKGLGGPGIIWGSIQQRTLEVVYDVGRKKIGFGYGACK